MQTESLWVLFTFVQADSLALLNPPERKARKRCLLPLTTFLFQMINWLKTLWKNLGNLSKGQFFHIYVLPGLAIFFSWGLIGHLYLITLDKSSLVVTKGQVEDIAIRFEQGTRASYKYYPLKIELTNYPEEFRLPDVYKRDFAYLESKIQIGDTITLYTRHKWQVILGWGKQIDIYEIDKNGETLFSISEVVDEKKNQATLFSIFAIVFWTWYIIYRRIRKA